MVTPYTKITELDICKSCYTLVTLHTRIGLCQFSLQQGFAIGGFLSQRKQPLLLYERTERFVVIHVVKCVACKNAGVWAYIITVLLGLQENIENRSVRSCTTMQRNYKESSSNTEQRITEKADTNNRKLALVFVNFTKMYVLA